MTRVVGPHRRATTIGLALALGLGAACAAPAEAQSLPEALASAYSTNPTLRAARAELRAVNEGVPQALSDWRPNVTVSGSAGKRRFDNDTSTSKSQDTVTPREVRADVSQPIYRGGQTVANTARAENEVRAQRARLSSVEQSVLLNAATAYIDVWRDEAVLGLNINNERVLQRHLEATQDRFTVGEVTRTDVAQAETRLAVARADRIAAEGALSASRAVFEEVVGFAPGELQAPERLTDLPASQEDVIDAAVERNPDILTANYSERAAQNTVRQVIGELLPSLQLRASASHTEGTSSSDSVVEQAQVLAELTVPLYQKGAVSSRVREAKQVSSQRRIEIEERRRALEQEGISAWQALQTARAQIRSFEAGVRSAEIALEGVQQENLVGARTILDILDAEQELLDAQVNLVRSQRDEVVAEYRVLSAVGRLTARDLGLTVEVYNPEIDYFKIRNRWFGLDAPAGDAGDE